MLPLLQLVWPGLVIAFTLGFAVGIATCSPTPPSRSGWVFASVVLGCFVVGAVLAVLELVPGRAGLWLETAVLLLAAYGPGCAFGGLLGRALRRGSASST
jgi:hypothetical protein